MSFSVSFPFLWLSLGLLLAGGVSYFLYRNNPLNIERLWLKRLLYALRFLSVWLICLLLLGPLLNQEITREEKPVIAVAIDNSLSVAKQKDAESLRNQLLPKVKALQDELGDKFLVKHYLIGESTRQTDSAGFTDKLSNLSEAIHKIQEEHYQLNLAAMVLLSDGIYNRGENPVYTQSNYKTPVYAVGLGDTALSKDLAVSQVKYNELVFEGNSIPILVSVNARFLKGSNATWQVSERNNVLAQGTLAIDAEPFFTQLSLTLPSAKEGLHAYTFSVRPLSGERNVENNSFTFQFQVVKTRQKVVLVAQHAHPDVGALVQTLKNNPNYEVSSYLIQDYQEQELADASLFILHQLPGINGSGQALWQKLQQLNKPVFHIIGKQSNLALLNKSGLISFSGPSQNYNEVQGWVQEGFNLFQTEPALQEFLTKTTPLISFYGNYSVPAEAQVLLKQQIGYVKTNHPLLYFVNKNGNQYAFLCGEGYWRWRLQDYLLNSNQNITQTLISKVVQWTAGKNNQGRFRVNPIKRSFEETEPVIFEAERYNASFELVQDKDITLEITNDKNKTFTYKFNKNNQAYELNAGKLSPGNYTFKAKVDNDPQTPPKVGSFGVKALQTELLNLTADHSLLRTLSAESQGRFFKANEWDKLIDEIQKNEAVKPLIFSETKLSNLLNSKWLFFLLCFWLVLEWFIRKWNGFI